MAAVTVCSDFGATVSIVSPSIFREVMFLNTLFYKGAISGLAGGDWDSFRIAALLWFESV